jgi:hypothetical protein
MRVSAPLLLDTADAFSTSGLQSLGYRYIIATEGWNQPHRAASGELQPAPSFTNASVRELSDRLHAAGFKLGIYGAAGFTTCGKRAGTLYHERQVSGALPTPPDLAHAECFPIAGPNSLRDAHYGPPWPLIWSAPLGLLVGQDAYWYKAQGVDYLKCRPGREHVFITSDI